MKKLICKIVKYIVDILSEIFIWCHDSINAPTLLTATLVPPNIDLAWQDNSDNETGFNIWRSDDGSNFTQIDTVPADTTTYTDTTATPGQDYWYEVQAFNDDATSDFSNIVETGVELTDINFGLLYNWYAATGNIAPAGWHLPSIAELETLMLFLDPDGSGIVNTAGGNMKETGLTYWNSPNTGADNSSLFNGRGSGYRDGDTGIFTVKLAQHRFWPSGQWSATDGYVSVLLYNSASFQTSDSHIIYHQAKDYGATIRLIKDDAVNTGVMIDYDDNIYPTVTIGTQVWMASNLIVKHYNDGTDIPEVTDGPTWMGLVTGAWCYYNNDSSNM